MQRFEEASLIDLNVLIVDIAQNKEKQVSCLAQNIYDNKHIFSHDWVQRQVTENLVVTDIGWRQKEKDVIYELKRSTWLISLVLC